MKMYSIEHDILDIFVFSSYLDDAALWYASNAAIILSP